MSHPTERYLHGTAARRVIDYATALFFERGIRQVTMDDIAKGLQMSKRTLYQIFLDKERLLMACIQVVSDEEHRMVQQLIAQQYNVLEIILRILEERMNRIGHISLQYFSDIRRYKSITDFIHQASEESLRLSVAFLEEGVRQGFFRSDVNFRFVVQSIITSMENDLVRWQSEQISFRECFINVGLFHLRGCCTSKGLEIIDRFLDNYRAQS